MAEDSGEPPAEDGAVEWWEEYLDSVYYQVLDMQHRRQLHDEFMAMLDAQDHPDTTFQEAFHRIYIESQVIAIRRLADDDARTLSLRRLLGQLYCRRKAFTRDAYVGRWLSSVRIDDDERRFHEDSAHAAFEKFTDNEGDPTIGPQSLQADIGTLAELSDQVARYANTYVAHSDRTKEAPPTYEEFHGAVDGIARLLQKYYLLLKQGSLMTTTPTIQGDWKGPFRRSLVAD